LVSARPTRLAGFQQLAVVTLGSTLALVALGGAVRATDSGLACTTWPGCFSAGDFVPALQLNVWLEHSHRLLAGVVGLQIAALLIWAIARYRRRRAILGATIVAAVAVNVQATLGALVVWRLLRAELVTAHLGMAMLILGCLVFLVVRATTAEEPAVPAEQRDLRFARLTAVVAALCFVQILIGGHVTGINAGLVFTDFPLMGGALFPPITSEQEAFHVAHRLVAYLLAGTVGYLCARAVAHKRALVEAGAWTPGHRWLVRLPMWAATLVVLQIGIGVANLHNGASFLTVIPHLAVASWIWTVLAFLTVLAHRRAPLAVELVDDASDEDRQTSQAGVA
jgi:cytochrome c oxidase assembly protein subunit 15